MANDSNAVWISMWIFVVYTCIVLCFLIGKLCHRHFLGGQRRTLQASEQSQTEESTPALHWHLVPTVAGFTSVLVGSSTLLLHKSWFLIYHLLLSSSEAGARRSPDRHAAGRKLPLPAR